jgi:thiol-disulfide isomerase/thioredoxin
VRRFCFLALLNIVSLVHCPCQRLQIGDTLPNLAVGDVINHKSGTIKLRDYRGKVLLIDLWNTHCTACFKLFPKLDSLQDAFRDEVQIILVNEETKEFTQAFFDKHPKIHQPNLPMLTSGKKIIDLFPVEGYPYSIWIDGEGVVRYFSGAHAITKNNVADFLSDRKLNLRDPTLVRYGSSVMEEEFEYFSLISSCSDSLNVGSTELIRAKNGKAVSISSNCSSISNLYLKAYSEYDKFKFNKNYSFIFDVKNRYRYENPSNLDSLDYWLNENAFNYELMLPVEKAGIAYTVFQQDLNRYFDLDARIEKRMVKSIILVRANESKRCEFQSSGDSVLHLNNVTFDRFIRELTVKIEQYFPFFDETGYKNKVTCSIRYSSLSPLNVAALKMDLLRAGFDIKLEERKVAVLVIREREQ